MLGPGRKRHDAALQPLRAVILREVWQLLGFLTPFQGLFKVKAIFLTALRCHLPFHFYSLSLYFILTNFSQGQHNEGMGFVETKHFYLFIYF